MEVERPETFRAPEMREGIMVVQAARNWQRNQAAQESALEDSNRPFPLWIRAWSILITSAALWGIGYFLLIKLM